MSTQPTSRPLKMTPLDMSLQTVFADLEQRCLDAEFDATFKETGFFQKKTVKGHDYWYYHERVDGEYRKKYVGPDRDPEIAKRVAAHQTIRDDYLSRRRLVSTLVQRGRLPAPNDLVGRVTEALWKAGLFRLRALMVGAVAYQTYSGLLGLRLPSAQMTTQDVDFAQFHSVSVAVEDSLPPIEDVLKSVDPSFRAVPHQSDGRMATQFVNDQGFKVEFLTPNTGSDDHSGKPAPMPALGGASAQTLRFLDFLIVNPVRSVLLHGGGIPVMVPAPERYAVHKLIVASRRRIENNASKRDKDVAQAGALFQALLQKRRHVDVADVWCEAWERGQSWRKAMLEGVAMLDGAGREALESAVRTGCAEINRDPQDYGFNAPENAKSSRR